MSAERTSLRELINAKTLLVLPAVYDGYSVRMASAAGFEAACISGSGLSESRLGLPDVGILDLTENVAATRALVGCAGGMYLIADGDTGYGNAVNVQHTVSSIEAAGASGIMIEDQAAPKRCGHMQGKEVIPADEMVGKLKAAIAARKDDAFVIEARTDAAAVLGLDEAIRRANLYADVGADLIIEDALWSREDIARFAGEVRAPVAVNMNSGLASRPGFELVSPGELQAIGVAVVGYSRTLSGGAVRGMQRSLEALRKSLDGGLAPDRPDLVATGDEISQLMRLRDILDAEAKYVPARPA